MLVINGVDAQTNSHTVGIVHNWSGRNSEGYPTLSALLAARYAPDLPVSYLSFRRVLQDRRYRPATLVSTRRSSCASSPTRRGRDFSEAEWEALESYRAATAERLAAAPGLLPAEASNRAFYRSAFATEGLKAYADVIPPEDELEQPEQRGHYRSTLRRQAQLTVLAFKTGVAVSADFWLGGFDTHANHDPDHHWLLGNLSGAVDYLWDYAERHDVADRMVVVMGSDFGRTNVYNASAGKDHWPIGSYVVMEKNQLWTNRVVGETDELHFAQRVNPATRRRDDAGGAIIYPKHVHKALRRYFGIEDSPGALRFPFNNTEDFAFFG